MVRSTGRDPFSFLNGILCIVSNLASARSFIYLIVILSGCIPALGSPEEDDGSSPYQVIKVNINTAALDSFLPFDEPFVLEIETPGDVTGLVCTLAITRRGGTLTLPTRTYPTPGPGGVISPAAPLKIESTGKFIVQFVVDAIPPNSDVRLNIQLTKAVPDLTSYTNSVRSQIEGQIKSAVKAVAPPTPFVIPPAGTWAPVQASLIAKFNNDYPGYTANFASTILATPNFGALPQINGLYTSYGNATMAMYNLTTNAAAATSPVVTLPVVAANINRFRDAFRCSEEKDFKSIQASNSLLQVISFDDSDWQLLNLGLITIDMSSAAAPAFPNLVPPNEDMSIDQLQTYLNRIDGTIAATTAAMAYINAEVIGNQRAYRFILGAAPSATQTTALNTDFAGIVTSLSDTRGDLLISRTQLANVITNLKTYESNFTAIIGAFKFSLEYQRILTANSSQDFETRGSWYISADAGIVFMPTIHEVQPYYGSNIYFAPVNKNAIYDGRHLRATYGYTHTFFPWLSKHASLSIGVIPSSIASADRRIENLWNNSSLLIGGGLRLGSAFRISGGSVLFRGYKADLLSTEKEIRASAFVSVSVDINLLKFFGKVGTALNLTPP